MRGPICGGTPRTSHHREIVVFWLPRITLGALDCDAMVGRMPTSAYNVWSWVRNSSRTCGSGVLNSLINDCKPVTHCHSLVSPHSYTSMRPNPRQRERCLSLSR